MEKQAYKDEMLEKLANWLYEEQCKGEGMESWREFKEIHPITKASYLRFASRILKFIKEVSNAEASL